MTKKLLLLTFAFLTFNAGVFAQDAPEVQNSLISKIAATWCGPCGGWGWGFFHDLEEDNAEKALVIAVHHSGDLLNPTAAAFTTNFGVFSQPRFILNNQDQNASSSNVSTKRTDIQTAVNSNNTNTPVANTGLTAFLDDDVITVKTNTKFFQNTSGEYFVGVYVVEDGVVNYQATIGEGAIHTNVLRTGLSANAFGESLANGDVTADTEFPMEFTIVANSAWNMENVTIASIIWKFENGKYTFVNTNSTNTFEETQVSSIHNIASANWTMKIQPTISAGDATIFIDLPTRADDFEVTVFNLLGSAVATLHQGALAEGVHQFRLTTVLPKGLYMVRSTNGKMVETRRMIVE